MRPMHKPNALRLRSNWMSFWLQASRRRRLCGAVGCGRDGFGMRISLDEAIEAFEAAAVMRPDAPEPAKGLRDVEARREAMEEDGAYNEVLAEADNYFDREQYERAIRSYDEASELKPAERYPRRSQRRSSNPY